MTPDEQPDQKSTPDFSAILNQLWTKYLPDVLERVSTLDLAVQACAAGTITTEIRAAAHSAAHKLAGTLGTFGLSHGTDLAREFEQICATDMSFAAVQAQKLQAMAAEIRAAIDGRNQ